VCPNFIAARRTFTCVHAPPSTHWGSESNKAPKGRKYNGKKSWPREKGREQGRFQYIAMELCTGGDIEEYLKEQEGEEIDAVRARGIFFQMVFACAAAKRVYGMKHYDVKNLNFLLQNASIGREDGEHEVVRMEYGWGGRWYGVEMKREEAVIAKLADYGTADMKTEEGGKVSEVFRARREDVEWGVPVGLHAHPPTPPSPSS